MTSFLQSTSLGGIMGRKRDGTIQYLGVPYATVRNRFAEAVVIESIDGGGILDATQYG
jgi:hypothetical protein